MTSPVQQAIRWILESPGRTQTEAAVMFGIKQCTISITMRRMRTRGQLAATPDARCLGGIRNEEV